MSIDRLIKCSSCGNYSDFGINGVCLTCIKTEKEVQLSGKLASPPETVCAEADRIVSTDRQNDYGPANKSFAEIAAVWSTLLEHTITPHQVALCMMGLKLVRHKNKPKRDNLVDICGYAKCDDSLTSP